MIRQQRLRVELPVILALGSNLGDREATLRHAVNDINAIDGVSVDAASRIVQTPALKISGVDHAAPPYLNAVLSARSALAPQELLKQLQRIENEHGRVRQERWGDRTLDIDIISFGQLQLNEHGLTIPHPRAAERAFVLVPLVQLAPDAVLAGVGSAADCLARITSAATVAGAAAAGTEVVGTEVTEFEAAPLW